MFHDYGIRVMFYQEAHTQKRNDIEKQRGRDTLQSGRLL